MASYVVMERPAGAGADPVLVRDGFHLLGFVLPVIWFLWHRMWIEAALALVATFAIALLADVAGQPDAGAAASLLMGLYVGLEGPALRMAALRRRGFRDWGAVEAGNPQDAELRYIAETASDAEEDAAAAGPWQASPQLPGGHASRDQGPALGLFSYPGRG